MIDYKQIEPYLTDRWEEILGLYGIEIPKMRGKNSINHPCPCCGGKDRAHWREENGRLALYCRNCAADSMKSPENVIMECTGISFGELVKNLNEFLGGVSTGDFAKIVRKIAAKPRRNMPQGHKQRDDALDVWDQMERVWKHEAFNVNGVQPPYFCAVNSNGNPCFDMTNENNAIVNIAALTNKGWQYLAGGVSYCAWHLIPKCEHRQADGIAWTRSVITAYHHWYKTGQETRVTFDTLNTIWMLNVGIISEHDIVLDNIDL